MLCFNSITLTSKTAFKALLFVVCIVLKQNLLLFWFQSDWNQLQKDSPIDLSLETVSKRTWPCKRVVVKSGQPTTQ